MKDPAVIRNYLGTYTLWSFTDGKLVDRKVPAFLYHLDLAEEACYDALDEDPAHVAARDMLAALHHAQWAAVQSLTEEAEASEEGLALIDKLWNVYLLTVSQGPDTQLGALGLGLLWGDEGISIGALGALPKVWDGRPIDAASNLVKALDGPKTVRFAAAVACLKLDPGAVFPGSEKVMMLAAQAADCGSARQVLLVEPDPLLRGKALKVLDDAGMFATAEASAVEGFRRAKEIGTFDVILIRADLKDQLALTIVKNLKEDFRTASTPILIVGTQAELDQAKELFATGVQDFLLIDPLDANRVKEAASGSLRDDQKRALDVSLAACQALAGIDKAKTAFTDWAVTEAALAGVVKSGKPDEIRLAALAALRNLGGAASLETIVSAFKESANAAPVRVAAALALGGILTGQPAPAGVFSALLEGVGDETREVRKAAAEGLGEMKLTPEQQNEVLKKYRVM
jgi:CheY-like chemotaxis protein